MRFRAFRNSDPPHLADIWSRQPRQRGLAQAVSPRVLDFLVFSKPYFDRYGLIVAENDEGDVIGFVHAGFGPNESGTNTCTEMGTTCRLLVSPEESFEEVATGLLAESEKYQRRMGAKVLYAGCIAPLNPFYLGLYGGSELPGILKSDTQMVDFYLRRDYEIIDRCLVLHRTLGQFRPPVDRQQVQLKRRYRVEADSQYRPRTWWESCTAPPTDTTQYVLYSRDGGPACGHILAWSIEPLSHQWMVHAAGIYHVQIDQSLHRRGLATYLHGEALMQLQLSGISLVEAQTMQHNTAALGLYRKLGFKQVDEGLVMRRRGN